MTRTSVLKLEAPVFVFFSQRQNHFISISQTMSFQRLQACVYSFVPNAVTALDIHQVAFQAVFPLTSSAFQTSREHPEISFWRFQPRKGSKF